MKQVVLIIALAVALTAAGCSKPAVNDAEAANANTAVETQFDGITDPNVALAEGKRLLDENQTELAIAALRQAVKLNPDLAEAYFHLGIAHSLLEMQMQLDGTEASTNSKEGRTKTNSEKSFEKAIEAYKKWLDANPKDDVAYYNQGRAYAKLMKDEQAEESFAEAVRLKPEDAEYETELGAIRIKLAKYHEALDPLKKAVELDPENVRAQDLLEDAEAGRQRLDYVSPKNTNANANANANSNANSNSNSTSNMRSNSNSNVAIRPSNTNSRSGREDPKPKPTKAPPKPN